MATNEMKNDCGSGVDGPSHENRKRRCVVRAGDDAAAVGGELIADSCAQPPLPSPPLPSSALRRATPRLK